MIAQPLALPTAIVSLANQATSGAIAAATVADIGPSVLVKLAQTTAGITLTCASPTVTTGSNSLRVQNSGTASVTWAFSAGDTAVIAPGEIRSWGWIGARWAFNAGPAAVLSASVVAALASAGGAIDPIFLTPAEVVATRVVLSGPGKISTALRSARNVARGVNPFDLQSVASQPLVSSLTISAPAYATPRAWLYSELGGPDRVRIVGAPYGDTTLMVAMGVNAVHSYNPSAFSAGFAEMLVDCQSLQLNLHSYGLSSTYFPIWVNGIPIHPTPGSLGNPTGNIQIDFAVRGQYNIAVGYELSLGVIGCTTNVDDTVHPVITRRLPIVLYSDSYGAGSTSPVVLGNVGLSTAMSWIGGVNVIPFSQTSIGHVNAGGTSPGTDLTRLAKLAAITNAASAKLVIIALGYNDVAVAATAAAIQAAAITEIQYVLSNTQANILCMGAWPGIRNNNAATQTVDAGIAAAVASLSSTGRVAFAPISGADAPWITGTRYTAAPTGGSAGNSRYYTGDDSAHASAFLTATPNIPANTRPNSGAEYLARRLLDAVTRAADVAGW